MLNAPDRGTAPALRGGASSLIGTHDVALITLDTLRYDVAVAALQRGRTPVLASLLPGGRWEQRHTSGSFTFAAHQAFLAGFLPTPAQPGVHPRLFALRFAGSETIGPHTCVLDGPNIAAGLAARGYHTLCVGGVGFFNKQTPLGSVLPGMFAESHWSPELGVADPRSTHNQVQVALAAIARLPEAQRVFLLLNVSALHEPNRIYSPGAGVDSPATMETALAYVDAPLGPLLATMRRRAPLLAILTSDHGTAYGEDGYSGHRHAHPTVWNVPYAELVLSRSEGASP